MSSYTSSLWGFFGFQVENGPTPSGDELHKAYRAEALKSHPDKNPNNPAAATARFQFLQKAYNELKELLSTGAIKNTPMEEHNAPAPETGSHGSGEGCNGCCQGEVPLKGRKAKETEKEKIKTENARAQAAARREKCAIIKEDNRQLRALQALKEEFEDTMKPPTGKIRKGTKKEQKTNPLAVGINIVEVERKVLALVQKQNCRNWKLRPMANCGYWDLATLKPDLEASFAAEKKELNFWKSAALNGEADAYLHFEGEDLRARQEQGISFDEEKEKEKEERNSQALVDRLNNFLAASETPKEKRSRFQAKTHKPMTYAEMLKNGKPDVVDDSVKIKAMEWTTQHLEDLRQEKTAVFREMEEAGTELVPFNFGQVEAYGKVLLPNMNHTLSHYIDPKKRHGSWKLGIARYAYEDVHQAELDFTRGAGFERGGKHFAYVDAYFEDCY